MIESTGPVYRCTVAIYTIKGQYNAITCAACALERCNNITLHQLYNMLTESVCVCFCGTEAVLGEKTGLRATCVDSLSMFRSSLGSHFHPASEEGRGGEGEKGRGGEGRGGEGRGREGRRRERREGTGREKRGGEGRGGRGGEGTGGEGVQSA